MASFPPPPSPMFRQKKREEFRGLAAGDPEQMGGRTFPNPPLHSAGYILHLAGA
jgi:hypothetical protein